MKNNPKCTPGNRICGKRCINENQTCLTDTNHIKYNGTTYSASEKAKIRATYKNKDLTLREKDARFKKLHAKSRLKGYNGLMVSINKSSDIPVNSQNIRMTYKHAGEEIAKENEGNNFVRQRKNDRKIVRS